MSASRRLPLATLTRTSAVRRRGGRGRLFIVTLLLVALGGAGFWYVRLRAPEPEVLTPIDEAALPTDPLPPAPVTPPVPLDFSAGTAAQPPAPAAPALSPPTAPAAPTPPVATTPEPPPIETDFQPRLPRDVFEAQIALMREATCPGSIDGAWGSQTRNAVAAFQQKRGLRVTGQLDNPTREALRLRTQPLRHYTITEQDVARLRPLPKGWIERSQLDHMGYSTVLEAVAERFSTHPNHLKRLNPQTDWAAIQPGTRVVVPNIGARAAPSSRPEYILVSLGGKTLQVFDAEDRLLAHFPCSIARRVEKRPVGELSILAVAPNPDYTFRPENFPDSPEAQRVGRALKLQPGPNNPVGTAWITLSAGDGSYGIHGSPEPEQIGRTESSGCFRLANWNAEYLLPLVRLGMVVRVEP